MYVLLPPEQGEFMSQFFQIHPENPQPRLIKQAVEILRGGGVIVYPTDSSYAIGCLIGGKGAVERIRRELAQGDLFLGQNAPHELPPTKTL